MPQARLSQLASFLDMSGDFWKALVTHPSFAPDAGGLCNGGLCNVGGGRSPKGILKHNCSSKRKSGSVGCSAEAIAAPPPLAPRAKAYRKCAITSAPSSARGLMQVLSHTC